MRATPLRCPFCQIVITTRERTLGVCPVCRESLEEPAPPPAAPPTPPTPPPPAKRRFPLAALAVALVAIVVAAALQFLVRPKPGTTAVEPTPAATPPSPVAPKVEDSTAKTAGPATATDVPPSPAPPETSIPPPATARVKSAATPTAPPRFREFDEDPILEIRRGNASLTENADGSWTLSRLDSRTHVRLRGRTGTLRVLGVSGGSTLDASDLDAREIILAGDIDGRSTVKLLSPHGRVEFRGIARGQSNITVTAPDGSVIFGDPANAEDRTIIDGGCRFMIIARELNLAGTVTGTPTHLAVAFLPEGMLKFRELSGNARLDYRRADASFPEIQVEAGKVTGRAKLTRSN